MQRDPADRDSTQNELGCEPRNRTPLPRERAWRELTARETNTTEPRMDAMTRAKYQRHAQCL
eukprot:10082342-Lingulodinium_polyedra.AAC.1